MTVREFREVLFENENQNLTIKELRAILFEVENQDDELTRQELARILNQKKI